MFPERGPRPEPGSNPEPEPELETSRRRSGSCLRLSWLTFGGNSGGADETLQKLEEYFAQIKAGGGSRICVVITGAGHHSEVHRNGLSHCFIYC